MCYISDELLMHGPGMENMCIRVTSNSGDPSFMPGLSHSGYSSVYSTYGINGGESQEMCATMIYPFIALPSGFCIKR